MTFTIDIRDELGQIFDSSWSDEAAALDDDAVKLFTPAPNAIEWVIRRDFANQPILFDYQRSYQIVRDFFELRCPVCNDMSATADCWRKTRTQLESEVLMVWSEDQKEDECPKCGNVRSQFVEDGLFEDYNQLHILAGQGSGKSYTCGYISTYMEHRLYCEGHTHPRGLTGYFGLGEATPLEASFLAASEVQAKDTVWAIYTNMRKGAPWLVRYAAWVKNEMKKQVKTAMKPWVYHETQTFIHNEHPSIRLTINSLHSNSGSMAGRRRVFSVLDEMARMNSTDSVVSAKEIYAVHENSLQTIRSRTRLNGCLPWSGAMISITSTLSRNDQAWTLWKRADAGQIPRMYTGRWPTWRFNPNEPFASFRDRLKKDPVTVMRDFGCEPPGAMHPVIANVPRFRSLAVDYAAKPRAAFEISAVQDGLGMKYVRADITHHDLMPEYPRYVVFDAGLNFDAFTGVCGYGRPVGEGRYETRVDWIFRIVPERGTEVYFDCVLDIVRVASECMRINAVEFDQWNSDHLIQQIRMRHQLFAHKRSLTSQDFVKFAADSVSGAVQLLPPALEDYDNARSDFDWLREYDQMSVAGAAIRELLDLQRDPDSGHVYNPLKGRRRGFNSDDLARVLVHLHTLVQKQGYTEKQGSKNVDDARRMIHETGPQLDPFVMSSSLGTGRGGPGGAPGDMGGMGGMGGGGGGGGFGVTMRPPPMGGTNDLGGPPQKGGGGGRVW